MHSQTTVAPATPAGIPGEKTSLRKSSNLLNHRGREFQLLDQPLERYFSMIGQRPCEGEYSANWAIDDGWLYLCGLACIEPQEKPLSMGSMFPFAGNRVFAAWYSGQVRGFRSDRKSGAEWGQPNHYPDLVLNMDCGRVETISLVHSTDRSKTLMVSTAATRNVASTRGTFGEASPSANARAEPTPTSNVLPFTPRSAEAASTPGWQGALV